jgi:hypothetical protein
MRVLPKQVSASSMHLFLVVKLAQKMANLGF